jgi:hypothetical protein
MPETQGLVGLVLSFFAARRGEREAQQRQMRLLETLALGGKRQLMLVSCCGEQFLVGGGLESVETIVRVRPSDSQDFTAKNMDERCR